MSEFARGFRGEVMKKAKALDEKLTSEQWDEKARGYGYFIPRDWGEYYIARLPQKTIDSFIWRDGIVDISLLRAGLAFETREEAGKLVEKLKKERA